MEEDEEVPETRALRRSTSRLAEAVAAVLRSLERWRSRRKRWRACWCLEVASWFFLPRGESTTKVLQCLHQILGVETQYSDIVGCAVVWSWFEACSGRGLVKVETEVLGVRGELWNEVIAIYPARLFSAGPAMVHPARSSSFPRPDNLLYTTIATMFKKPYTLFHPLPNPAPD